MPTIKQQQQSTLAQNNQIGVPAMSQSLSSRAMLTDLTIGFWEARKMDKPAGKEIAVHYGSATGQARLHKDLIAKARLEKLRKIRQDARADRARLTLPWLDNGARVLPSDRYFDYVAVMNAHKDAWAIALPEFVDGYPDYIIADKPLLGQLWRAEDYPSQFRIADKFRFITVILPLPDAGDFRSASVPLPAAEKKRLAAEYASFENEALRRTITDIGSRITRELIGTEKAPGLIRKLQGYNGTRAGRFNDSVIGNVRALTAELAGLNIAGSAELDALIGRIESELCPILPDALRDDGQTRETTIAKAESILADMAGFI